MEFRTTRATIGGSAAFQYTADLRPLAAIPGGLDLTISSTFAGATDPAPRVVVFQVTLDRACLSALCGLIVFAGMKPVPSTTEDKEDRGGVDRRARV